MNPTAFFKANYLGRIHHNYELHYGDGYYKWYGLSMAPIDRVLARVDFP